MESMLQIRYIMYKSSDIFKSDELAILRVKRITRMNYK